MEFFARHPTLRQSVALLLAAILCGCASWQPVLGPQSYLAAERPSHVRAFLSDGQALDLYSPKVVVNDLVGFRQKGVDSTRISIPMQYVRRVEVWRNDEVRTGTLILVVTGAAALVGLAAMAASSMCMGCGFAASFPR
ncbi:MAG: hypothetical protein ABSG61_04905 [Gemmatimonadales bacterium]|jgi:hypothetical protein